MPYLNLSSRGAKAGAAVKKFRLRRLLKSGPIDALKAPRAKKRYYGLVIPKPKFILWIKDRATVTVGDVLDFITTRGEVRSFPAVRERLEDKVNLHPVLKDMDRAVSFDANNLPPASAETEAYIADMMKRVDERRAESGSANLLNPKDHVINGKVVVRSGRGESVRISGGRGETLSVKSF